MSDNAETVRSLLLSQPENRIIEAAVQAKMYEDRVVEEVIRRIQIRNERKMNNDET